VNTASGSTPETYREDRPGHHIRDTLPQEGSDDSTVSGCETASNGRPMHPTPALAQSQGRDTAGIGRG
jgi:hypothetical protein